MARSGFLQTAKLLGHPRSDKVLPSFGQGSTLFALFFEALPQCRQSLQG
jgi:hypothetical protein